MGHVSNCEKLKLLIWKNWITLKSHKWQILFALSLPILCTLLAVALRSTIRTQPSPTVSYEPLELSTLDTFNALANPLATRALIHQLAYSPTNQILENICNEAVRILKLESCMAFPNANDMEETLAHMDYIAGVEFYDNLTNLQEYPRKLSFTLRFPTVLRTAPPELGNTWLTDRLSVMMNSQGPRNPSQNDGGIPVGYYREGFVPIQHALSIAFMSLASGAPLPTVTMQRYPYPAYIQDPLHQVLQQLMSLIILMSFIYSCTYITKFITTEKEKQLKEVMKIMGLNNWLHWIAWFVNSFVMMSFSCLIIALLLTIKWSQGVAVLTFTSYSVLIVFLLAYILASITFCFMIATFFAKASTAVAVSGLIWFVSFFPYSLLMHSFHQLSLANKLAWCLLSNTAMRIGFHVILAFEGSGEGLQWSNMFSAISIDDSLCLGYVMIMMLISSIIYMIICLYVEQIYPGDFGVPKKWNFLFTLSFWTGKNKNVCIDDMTNMEITRKNRDGFEPEPIGNPIGLELKNLGKKFGNKTVVKGISVNVYKDEILVLLGHNGAGKSTTINMLTGMIPPTSGTAFINKSDIRTNIKGARSSLGFCPQHNVLFDNMTVTDHLVFFSRLKGLKGDALRNEVNKYLKLIELENKANELSSKLSGGMKRKLSVCCALCGNTKVVLCDEPSSGMDPAARRQLWNLLQKEKIGRTMLITTHYMDEADVLGDRIAIMCDGILKCHGTSFFLKKRYGSGYRLICVKKKGCDINQVTNLLSVHIPNIQPSSDIGSELCYNLPDEYAESFPKMLSDLEAQSTELKLDGYGIGITSLEEVFMKVGSEDHHDSKRIRVRTHGDDYQPKHSGIFAQQNQLLKGRALNCNQLKAMMLKKILYTWRNKVLFIIQAIVLIFFALTAIIVSKDMSSNGPQPPMTLRLTQYPAAVTVLETSTDIVADSYESKVADKYRTIATSYGRNYEYASTEGQSFMDYILRLGETIQARIDSKYLAAASVHPGRIITWLNNQPLHTAALALNMVHNAMVKALFDDDAEIVVTNYPRPSTPEMIFAQMSNINNLGNQLAMNLCCGMGFVTAIYVISVIKERESRTKLLQFVGGVNVLTYWCTHFIWDLFTFMIITLIMMLILLCIQEAYIDTVEILGRYFLFIMLFGFAAIPLTYYFTKQYKDAALGYARVSLLNTLTGIIPYAIVAVLSIGDFVSTETMNQVKWVLRWFPHFSLALGVNKLYTNDVANVVCSNEAIRTLSNELRCRITPECCIATPYLAWEEPGILPEIVCLATMGIFFFFYVVGEDLGWFEKFLHCFDSKKPLNEPPQNDIDEDDDVKQERLDIIDMSPLEFFKFNLILDRVSKYYKDFPAVKEVSLCVKPGECFGLLGVNGAGKTTIFKMMTGDERITSGSAYIRGMNLSKKKAKIYKEIGYCPQFDALFDFLTGREQLRIFCLLRGVHSSKITTLSEKLAKSFGFYKHIDKITTTYSGGIKRKLSTALAVIGRPSVIYLDEPTTGMDPVARRKLWNLICGIRDYGKSIVLTSHSIEECEALCTRLAIIVNGEIKCIGPAQLLKNKFSKGIILHIKVKRYEETESSTSTTSYSSLEIGSTIDIDHRVRTSKEAMYTAIAAVKEFVGFIFPQAVLEEEFQGILTFNIPISAITWSKIFATMEQSRKTLSIEDYSISQTSLEQIFLEFAKHQGEDGRPTKILNAYMELSSYYHRVSSRYIFCEVYKGEDELTRVLENQYLETSMVCSGDIHRNLLIISQMQTI